MDVILGLNKPFPIRNPIPIYKNKGVSTAIDAWPKVIKAPSTTAQDTLSNDPPGIPNYGRNKHIV
jgi:hypothetical protein